ncbi:WD40-repeat-containing domain protein [Myxozyma melibiosi]|uniref:WD40-repeat-containing domain protein n=1 Tax=Myxozyma melibiosi TaxID=54550 RepID=A0ABR1F0E4_9ASCO
MSPVALLQPADDISRFQYLSDLERSNALRRGREDLSPVSSPTKKYAKLNKREESWIRELVKPPSLENLKPQLTSAQLKVPDAMQHLTAIASHPSLPFVAVGSGGREKNLYIYERGTSKGRSHLYHRQTVSLPHIYSLAWAPLGKFTSSTVIATGHRNGAVHLVSLPDSSNPYPARIIKRFNHAHADPRRIACGPGLRVSHVEFTSPVWTCVPDASLISLYGQTVHIWDLSRNDRPLLTQRVATINGLHASPFRDGILGLSGAFGIALLDVRTRTRGLLRPKIANHSESTAVKWSPYNSNWVASAHEDSKIRVWDIRASQPFAELAGHSDIINTLEWSATNPNELISGCADQTINVWDVTSTTFNYDTSKSKEKYFTKLERREDATLIPPEAVESARRRRALFTILEDPDDSAIDETAEGVKSYRQSASVIGLASVDVPSSSGGASNKEFCSISTDTTVSLHQMCARGSGMEPVKRVKSRKANAHHGFSGMIEARNMETVSRARTLL